MALFMSGKARSHLKASSSCPGQKRQYIILQHELTRNFRLAECNYNY
jgi:hypothetical protein